MLEETTVNWPKAMEFMLVAWPRSASTGRGEGPWRGTVEKGRGAVLFTEILFTESL